MAAPTAAAAEASTAYHLQYRARRTNETAYLTPHTLSLSLFLYLSPSFFPLRAQQLWLKAFCRLRPPRHALDRPRMGLCALREHAPAEIGARTREEPRNGRGVGMSPRLALPWWDQEDAFHSQQPCVRRPRRSRGHIPLRGHARTTRTELPVREVLLQQRPTDPVATRPHIPRYLVYLVPIAY